MLHLVFELGGEQLALDHRVVVEVVPAVSLTPIQQAPDYVAGMLNYRGEAVPVVDLVRIAANRSARPQLSTRIVIVRSAAFGLLGLVAERALECRHAADSSSANTSDATGTWRRVTVDDLLPAELREVLRRES